MCSSDLPDFPKRGIVFKDIMPLRELGQSLHRLVQRVGVGEERHDVFEDDPAFREVRDVSDLRREVVRHLALRDRAEGAPEEQVRKLLRKRRESLQILEAGVATLGVP